MTIQFLSDTDDYILLFMIFGVLGWAIDTAYRSFEAKKYTRGTYFPFFAPSYGIGGVIMVLCFRYLQQPEWLQVLITWPLIVLFEFASGLFCVHVLGRRYWDYSKNTGSLMGHVCLLHSMYWLLLTALVRVFFYSVGIV